MKFTVADLRLFAKMVEYSNSDDVKELSTGLHDTQPYFCQIIQTIAYDPRCVEVYRFCLLFCAIASEHAERVLQRRYEEYVMIPKEYFETMAHMIAQKNHSIGKRGRSYPVRVNGTFFLLLILTPMIQSGYYS